MWGVDRVARRQVAVCVLGVALIAGGQGFHLESDVVEAATTPPVAQQVAEESAPTPPAAVKSAFPAGKPCGDIAEAPPGVSSQPTTSYLTKNLAKVKTLKALRVYSCVDMWPGFGTQTILSKGSLIQVHAVHSAQDGTPRLSVSGGYISASVADVARPTLTIPKAREVYAFDVDTGEVLYQKNANKATSVASLAKLMTALIVRDEVAAGRLTWDTKISITDPNLVRMSTDWNTGGRPLKVGQTFTLKQLDTLSVVSSHNAAVTQIGIYISGNNAKFVRKMNAKAAKLGMTKSTFISVSGLDTKDLDRFGLKIPGTQGGNQVSAKDMATLTAALLKADPGLTTLTKKSSVKVKGKKARSTNQLLEGFPFYKPSLGVDGLKTGYTGSAGYCLVATAKPSGRHRVAVVIVHAKNSKNRFEGASKLLESIYARYPLS